MKRLFMLGLMTTLVATQAPRVSGADADISEVETAISRVTVYSDRARVTRSGKIRLEEGRQRIAVSELPFALDDASVSAALPGATKARLLSIEVEESHGKRTATKEAEELLEKLEDMQRKNQTLTDQINALNSEESFLSSLSVQTQTDEHGQPKPVALSPRSWESTLDFASNRLTELRKQRRKIEHDRNELAKETQALNVEIQKVRSYQTVANKRVVLELNNERAGAIDVEVTYALRGAAWRPSYDVRVLSSSGKVEVTTYGVVQQSTGEDWSRVELTFSTASPRIGADLPELLAWRLGDQQQVRTAVAAGDTGRMDSGYAEQAGSVANAPKVASTRSTSQAKAGRARRERDRNRAPEVVTLAEEEPMDEADSFGDAMSSDDWGGDGAPAQIQVPANEPVSIPKAQAAATPAPSGGQQRQQRTNYTVRKMNEKVWSLPPGADFEFRSVERDQFAASGRIIYCPTPRRSAGGFDYAYQPDRKKTVASDGRERRIQLATTTVPAELMYEIVAPLQEKAYLRTTVKNDARRPLLAGESFIFLDDDFVGRAFIDTIATNESLELSLGTDDDLKVERKLEESAENTGLISKKERTEYEIVVKVKSYKKRAVTVLVRDQVPVTWQKDDIKIEDVEARPKPAEDPDRGMYEWKAKVQPGKTREFKLSYVVIHPRDFELVQRRVAR